jgi:antitoxin (DNA-binding transcriptional repressor) of toxin-antitoxin stability system
MYDLGTMIVYNNQKEVTFMLITATELRNNLAKYLSLAGKEDIIIIRNGKQIAKLTGIQGDRETVTDTLIGIIPSAGTSLD